MFLNTQRLVFSPAKNSKADTFGSNDQSDWPRDCEIAEIKGPNERFTHRHFVSLIDQNMSISSLTVEIHHTDGVVSD